MRADVVTVDLRGLHTTPVLHGDALQRRCAPGLLGARATTSTTCWVDGRRLVAGGDLLTVDVRAIRATAQAAAEELFDRRARYLAGIGTARHVPAGQGSA